MAPGTCASFGRSRVMTSSAEIFRSSRGFSEMKPRPVFAVVPRPPPPPVNRVTVSTAGSASKISA